MGKENLSLIHSQETVELLRKKGVVDLTRLQGGTSLIGLVVVRPASSFTFKKDRLNRARLTSGPVLEVISNDPDGITRLQRFQYTQDTAINLKFAHGTGEKTISLELEKPDSKIPQVHMIKSVDHNPA